MLFFFHLHNVHFCFYIFILLLYFYIYITFVFFGVQSCVYTNYQSLQGCYNPPTHNSGGHKIRGYLKVCHILSYWVLAYMA